MRKRRSSGRKSKTVGVTSYMRKVGSKRVRVKGYRRSK